MLLAFVSVLGQEKVDAAAEVRLVASADFGARSATASVLSAMAELAPDAALAVGDLAYRDMSPESRWCAFVKDHVGEGFPFQLLSGNHESQDLRDGSINNFSACLPNQVPGTVGTYGREYYYDLPRSAPLIRVINASPALTFEDGSWDYARGDMHYKWLSRAIDDGRAKGARWIVVAAHVPCLSIGGYSCPRSRDFYDLLLEKRVDLVIHGHEHGYMRTHQLRTGVSGCSSLTVGSTNAACVADRDDDFESGQGTVFATVGTGGFPLRELNLSDPEVGYFAKYSGSNLDPTFGLLDVQATDTRLAVRFMPTAGMGMTDRFVVQRGARRFNSAPEARLVTTQKNLTVLVDGSGSRDADGSLTLYAWRFGDGGTATGAAPPAHTYRTPGTYTIGLTVTDDAGATHSVTTVVKVAEAGSVVARDSFDRSVASGWGSASAGGPWSVTSTAPTAVRQGRALVTSGAGAWSRAYLRAVRTSSAESSLAFSPNKVATGSGYYIRVVGRSVNGQGEYRAKVRLRGDGGVDLGLVRASSTGVETAIGSPKTVPNLRYSPGSMLRIRMAVTGTNPTTIQARVWQDRVAEPATWLVTAVDRTSGLQAAGSPGLLTHYSGAATNAPFALSIDDYLVAGP